MTHNLTHPPKLSTPDKKPPNPSLTTVGSRFPFSEIEFAGWLVGLHVKNWVQPTRLAYFFLQMQIWPNFDEMHQDLHCWRWDLHHCSSLVSTWNKSPSTQTKTDSTCGFWRLAAGQLLCHPKLAGWFRVGHKLDLDRPVNSLNYDFVKLWIFHGGVKWYSIRVLRYNLLISSRVQLHFHSGTF